MYSREHKTFLVLAVTKLRPHDVGDFAMSPQSLYPVRNPKKDTLWRSKYSRSENIANTRAVYYWIVALLYCPLCNVFNSSPSSDAYMLQWIGSALIQVMACRQVGDKPLKLNQCWFIVNLDPFGTNFNDILIKIQNFSFTKNASENIVCEMAAILSRGRWVNPFLDRMHNLYTWFGRNLSMG